VNLRLLDFNDNMLNSLPAEIGNLTSLKKLNLGGNLLKELPPEIGYVPPRAPLRSYSRLTPRFVRTTGSSPASRASSLTTTSSQR
jgi:Leucine-rich repeat (LRR) protein